MGDIPIFFIEPTDRDRIYLRRYASGPCGESSSRSYHDAMTPIGTELVPPDCDRAGGDHHPHDDPRWPIACEGCGRPFDDSEPWQLLRRRIYRRCRDGCEGISEEMTLDDAPVGACWDAPWLIHRGNRLNSGPDGRCLVVKTPGGEWVIDSRASNCTMPDDDEHRCWIRHGRPEAGTLHVDKNGKTCAAGAGSIQAGAYHGFLHHGKLTNV